MMWFLVVVLLCLCWLLVSNAPADAQTEDSGALLLAQVSWLEASFSDADTAAIYAVAVKRAERQHVDWAVALIAYSAIGADTPRARQARAFGYVTHEGQRFDRAWAQHLEFAEHVVSGDVATPCRGADGWAGPRADGARLAALAASGRITQVHCTRPTRNVFVRHR